MQNLPAIVVVGYNRLTSLKRLIRSILTADYPDHAEIPIIFSIDYCDDHEVAGSIADYVNDVYWPYGEKVVIQQPIQLGLKNHILVCGDLTEKYGSIILLEDDLYVATDFYNFAYKAVAFYSSDEKIAGISLYSPQYNETASLPFQAINDGYDVFFMQLASSWGQVWLDTHWAGFREWYRMKGGADLDREDERVPPNVRMWPHSSWKKYFTAYLVEKNLFLVYPQTSFSTNFGDEGTHHVGTNVFQVPIKISNNETKFCDLAESKTVYDSYCELSPSCFVEYVPWLSEYLFDVDLYGMKRNKISNKPYFITTRKCSTPIKSYGRAMRPHEINVFTEQAGEEIKFAPKKDTIDYQDYQIHHSQICSDHLNVIPYYYSLYPYQYRQVRAECQDKITELKKSVSFRLGHSILSPFYSVYNFLKKLID